MTRSGARPRPRPDKLAGMNDTLVTLLTILAGIVVGAIVLYFVVRAAVFAALRTHSLWHADGSYEIELQRHRRDATS